MSPGMRASTNSAPARDPGRLAPLEVIKAFALLWICLVHWAERVFGSWYIANPANDWPPLAERIAQLTPLSGSGFWDIPLTLLLGFARAGDQVFSCSLSSVASA